MQVGGALKPTEGASVAPSDASRRIGLRRQSRRSKRLFITRCLYPAAATEPSPSPGSVGGGSKLSTLSSGLTASPPGVSTSTRV